MSQRFVAKWYTRASRVRIVIAKFDGRWKLPGGPYPIPELAALVAGVLATLFLLPRLGHPVLTALVGIAGTVSAVGAMRLMPYSPVKFGTRVHRVVRLYNSPISYSTSSLARTPTTTSTVRPQIDILDATEPATTAASYRRPAHPRQPEAQGFADMFGDPRSAAADLFS
jgi:hypothetical protein